MYKLLVCFFIFFISKGVVAQAIKGTVYDDKTIVAGVLVKNLRTRITTITDDEGHFVIDVQAQDSISFYVFTHVEKTIVLKEGEDYKNFVVELTRKVNQLDEVFIEKEISFKEERFKENYESALARHIRLYPEQYEFNSNPNANLNFVNIGKRLWRLIKKEKPKPVPFVPIKLEEYIVLFKEDKIINDTFLTETIKIPLEFKPLFIDFCLSKNINSKLLKEKDKFLLIEEFINRGKEFLELLETEIDD